ncbi:hypothetical protein [Paracoccus sanguinis]|uniref:Uncharacterized protein n=1 Tax=Paracoccus sanguinis TaxID=1545044 RepID=A0A1H3B9X9_9RHOB|nr:hypothetical protein [Paracoccus sanguinis]KGJ18172.1 hypothetical protein IX57_05325 [Paracoccus sanguinis]SDX38431.1 hypothetical protein SAMN05444276_105127 [Paracoccus sanguinis]
MTRLTLAALLACVLLTPAVAQTTAPEAQPAATAPATAPTPADDAEDDDDGSPAAPVAAAAPRHHDYGPSGILSRANREDLPPLTLAAGKPLAQGEYTLQSGGYYRIEITADGSQELALSGGDFFRAVWVDEIVVNDIEVRPMGVHSLEFDAAGTARLTFVAIVPGRYVLSVPGARGESQQAVFTIR